MNKFVKVLLASVALTCVSTYGFAGGVVTPKEFKDSKVINEVNTEVGTLKVEMAKQADAINSLSAKVDAKEDKMNSPYYVGVNGGIIFATSSDIGGVSDALDYEDGYTLGIAAGREFNNFRAELALDYQKVSNDEVFNYDVWGNVNLTTVMVNAYYTYPVTDSVGIYGMCGAGIGSLEVSDGAVDDDSIVFAGAVGVGVTYDINDSFAADIGWKYMITSDADIEDTTLSYASNAAVVGFRYKF